MVPPTWHSLQLELSGSGCADGWRGLERPRPVKNSMLQYLMQLDLTNDTVTKLCFFNQVKIPRLRAPKSICVASPRPLEDSAKVKA